MQAMQPRQVREKVPDPMAELTSDNLGIQPDGSLECYSAAAEAIVLKLDLNSPEMISWRLLWIRIVELARDCDASLYERLMGFPDDPPNLGRLRPPGGNSRPDGIAGSYYALRSSGKLFPTY